MLSKLQKTALDDSKEAVSTADEKKESTSSDTEEGEIKENSKGENDEVIDIRIQGILISADCDKIANLLLLLLSINVML